MFKAFPIQLVQEESDDLIQMINPEQDSDLKPEDLPEELSILPIKKYSSVSRCCYTDNSRQTKIH
jgi:hypothetical protein